jgi:hypothetical protein
MGAYVANVTALETDQSPVLFRVQFGRGGCFQTTEIRSYNGMNDDYDS